MDSAKKDLNFLKIGLLGSLLSVLADVFLAYYPDGISGFTTPFTVSIDKVYTVLAQASHPRLILSNYLSAVGIPLGWFGLYFFYKHLKACKQRLLSLVILVLGTIGYAAGTLFHVSLSYTATLFRTRNNLNSDNYVFISETINYFRDFSQPFAYLFLASIIVVSLLLGYAFLWQKIGAPRWLAFATPLFIELLLSTISFVAAASAKTFLIISIYNLSLFIFYSICFWIFSVGSYSQKADKE